MCDKTSLKPNLQDSTVENGLRKKLFLLIVVFTVAIVFSEVSFNPYGLSAEQNWQEWFNWVSRAVVGFVFGLFALTWTRVALFSVIVFLVQVIFIASFAYFDPAYLVSGYDLAKEFGISPNIVIVSTIIYFLFPTFVGFCIGHVSAILSRKFRSTRPEDL